MEQTAIVGGGGAGEMWEFESVLKIVKGEKGRKGVRGEKKNIYMKGRL